MEHKSRIVGCSQSTNKHFYSRKVDILCHIMTWLKAYTMKVK